MLRVGWALFALLVSVESCTRKTGLPAPAPPPPAAAQAEPPPAPPPPPPPKPVIGSFTVDPSAIEKGQSATLRWNTSDASRVSIANGVGTVDASGDRRVSPSATTTYTLTAEGSGGTATQSVKLWVTEPPPPPPRPSPVASMRAPEPYATVRIFYATDRKRGDPRQPALFYGAARYEPGGNSLPLELGTCDVSIPFSHHVGELESPSWWKLEFRQDPERHIVLMAVSPMDGNSFLSGLKQRVAGSPGKDAFLFIHGYNTTFEDAARRTAQMAHDLKFQGAPILYSWPSQGEVAKYTFDENNIEWTAKHLTGFLQTLSEQSGATTIHLIAHSMGNRALAKALESLPKKAAPQFRQVVLAAPDIDAGVFKQMAAGMKGKAERITLYASSKDRALLASKQVHGEPRAGDSEKIVVVDGVDSIDASLVETDFLGHGYLFKNSILFDMDALFRQRKPPKQRDKLKPQQTGASLYWQLSP